jgi:hypothetical protein
MCVVWFAIGNIVVLIAYWPVGWLLRWLRHKSRISGTRAVQEIGVPRWIVGSFERLLALFLVALEVEGAYTLLAAWLY